MKDLVLHDLPSYNFKWMKIHFYFAFYVFFCYNMVVELEKILMENFNELNISKEILDALLKIDITTPTPIQKEAIPLLLNGDDVIGQAQTGTGKTFAYSIPLIENLDYSKNIIQALVLCPTRELSSQVAKEIKKLAKNIKKIKIATIYGGESYDRQAKALSNNPQIIIGTPGRIIDQMNRNNIDFSNIKVLVLDEADEMLKMGFQDDLETILKTMPSSRQTALFSATMPPFIKNISKHYMNNPKMVKIENKTLTVDTIDQQVYYVKKEQKKDLLVRLLDYFEFKSVMIFTNTKAMVDELVLFLQSQGYSADGLHGDLKQASRDRVMQSFRTAGIQILIATDVAARGIDIDGIEAIFNYDIPNENEIYVHRIGRTGRKGSSGCAITFATTRSKNRINELEVYTKQKITVCKIPTSDDIYKNQQKKLYLNIVSSVENNADNHKYDALISKLSRNNSNPIPLLVGLLSIIDKKVERQYVEITDMSLKQSKTSKKTKTTATVKKSSKKMSYIEINIGEIDKIRPNQLVVFLHDELKIHREHFGKIIIKKKYTFFELNSDAVKYLKDLPKKKFNGRSLNYRIIDQLPRS